MEEKLVHLFRLCRMIWKDNFLVGIPARNINSKYHYICFGLEFLCMHVLF